MSKLCGIGCFVSTLMIVYTPQRGPLEAMLTSRWAAESEKFAGKFATIRN